MEAAAGRHTVPRRPGAARHDPAWNGSAFSCRHSACGNGSTHVYGDYRRRQSRAQPLTVPTTPRGGATKRSVRIHPRASRWRSRHRRHLPKSEIPIAIACGPRVPSSGTFVRLPAPETLHDSRPTANRKRSSKAVISRYRQGVLTKKWPLRSELTSRTEGDEISAGAPALQAKAWMQPPEGVRRIYRRDAGASPKLFC